MVYGAINMKIGNPCWLYMHHNQELEDVIDLICQEARVGNYSFTLNTEDDFSESELEYIEKEVKRRVLNGEY